METKIVKSKVITLEDIVFENRNKEYGAYFLSKKHREYLFIAFIISLLIASSSVSIPFYRALKNFGIAVVSINNTPPVIFEPIEPDIVLQHAIPVPPVPALPKSFEKQVAYAVPVVVEKGNPENQPAPNIEIIPIIKNEPFVVKNPPAINKTPEIVEPQPILSNPEEPATFRDGDINTFRSWVMKRLVYPPLALENGITGKVQIQFCVNLKGEVTDVKILHSAHPSLDEETLRVIMSSPKWKPARQGGYVVKQQFTIPVLFLLNKS
jgi:protein TonB